MDRFNTPWRVTAAAIYTTPTDSRVYGTLDIDVTEAKKFIDRKREEGIKLTMVHMTTAVLARAIGFDVPEMNCFIRRGAVVGREHVDVMLPVQVGGDTGVTAAVIRDAHGWGWAFLLLAPGPVVGMWAMRALANHVDEDAEEAPVYVSPFF